MSSPKFIVGKPNRWNRLTQGQKAGVVALVGGVLVCGFGVYQLFSDGISNPFEGWGIWEWLFKGVIPLLILSSIYVLIVHKSSDLLKFTAGFVIVLLVLMAVGKGVSGTWQWLGSLFTSVKEGTAGPPGPGFAHYSANSNTSPSSAPVHTPVDHQLWNGVVDPRWPWKGIGVEVKAGDTLVVESSGKIVWANNSPQNEVGPDGADFYPTQLADSTGFPLPGAHCASLIVRIGDKVYSAGKKAVIIASERGVVEFMVNDRMGWLGDNSGQFAVKLSLRK